jgi:integral membrane protein
VSSFERATARLLPGWVATDDPASALRGIEASLTRYRILAYIVGIGLAVLVFIGIPLQVAAHSPGVVKVVGPLHGFIYIIYLFAAFDMARRARFTMPQMLMMLCAGLLPILAFVIERKVTARVRAEVAAVRALRPEDGP